jgi:hypothetical protein
MPCHQQAAIAANPQALGAVHSLDLRMPGHCYPGRVACPAGLVVALHVPRRDQVAAAQPPGGTPVVALPAWADLARPGQRQLRPVPWRCPWYAEAARQQAAVAEERLAVAAGRHTDSACHCHPEEGVTAAACQEGHAGMTVAGAARAGQADRWGVAEVGASH